MNIYKHRSRYSLFVEYAIEITRPMVNQLENYPWSSYPAYINKTSATDWLCREKVYQMLGKRKKYQGYQAYVAQGVNEEIHQY